MDILILGFTKMKFMPYINFYMDNIDKKNNIDIIYWNRDTIQEDLSRYKNVTFHEFNLYQNDSDPKISKIKSFLKYRKFVISVLLRKRFDKLIVLHTLPGMLILDKLKKYRNNYILDYRDFTFEQNSVFKFFLWKMVRMSQITFVSSDAYRKFMPLDCVQKIFTSHNILRDSLLHRDDKEKKGCKSDKIRISFWGLIRHEKINKQIISCIANDESFELHYYGREQQTAHNLKAFSYSIGAKNVYFHGEYVPEDRYEMIKYTDIIHNLYCDNNTKMAMGNKYYDGIIFRIPQICMPSTFMGDLCESSGVGAAINPFEDNFLERIKRWYFNIDYYQFKKNCDLECQRVLAEYERGCEIIQQITFNE